MTEPRTVTGGDQARAEGADRCGYAITDSDGEMQPCDRPITGWRWYQNVGEHEDMLDAACDWHANEGGRRIHDAEAALDRVEALAEAWERVAGQRLRHDGCFDMHRYLASDLRAALLPSPSPQQPDGHDHTRESKDQG